MNCERCQIELEDFLYGELAERAAVEVRQHLADCSDCAAERERLESENALFAEFYEQTAIDPLPETWEAIRSRIGPEPVRVMEREKHWWQTMVGWLVVPSLARQVALAVMLIAVSVAATVWYLNRVNNEQTIAWEYPKPVSSGGQDLPTPNPPSKEKPSPRSQQTRKPDQASAQSDQEVLARQLVRTEREYQNAIKLLDRAVAKRRNGFDPDAFKKYESSLALIDSSIAQSKRALRELPNDLVAGQFLLAAYARKVELMQEIAMQ